MQIERIEITSELGGALVVPDGEGPWPVVVMVHEVFGIDAVLSGEAIKVVVLP